MFLRKFVIAGMVALVPMASYSASDRNEFNDWVVSTSEDAMTDERKALFFNKIMDEVYMGFSCGKYEGKDRRSLVIRTQKGVFSAPGKKSEMKFRVDKGVPVEYKGVSVGYKMALYNGDFSQLVRQMKAGDKVLFRAYAAGGGGGIVEGSTTLSGFAKAYDFALNYCAGK